MGIKDCPENVALPSSYVGSAGSPKKTPSLATWWSRDPSRSPILKQNGPSESRLIQCFSFLVWNDCIYIIYTYSNCLKLHVIIMLLFDIICNDMLLLLIWPLVAHWDPPKGLNIDTKRLTPRGAHSGCNFSTWQLGRKSWVLWVDDDKG